MAAPTFFTIASDHYSGYNVTQRGSQVVLAAANTDNPFQLWYKDDTWRFLVHTAGDPAFVLINIGSKMALTANSKSPSKVALAIYDPSHKVDELLWSFRGCSDRLAAQILRPTAFDLNLDLGLGPSPPISGDGIAVVLNTPPMSISGKSATQRWNFTQYVPPAYTIQAYWATQFLIAKIPHKDVTFKNVSGTFNDELTVVAVHQANRTSDEAVWYRIPARGQEDSNSSFIIVNKSNGKALKGSTKPGDKIILTEYDVLDNNFVWSEDRKVNSVNRFVAINLANGDYNSHWYLQTDGEFQNAPYYHPLTLREPIAAGGFVDRQAWQFIPVATS